MHDSVIFDLPPDVDKAEFAQQVLQTMTNGTIFTLRTRFKYNFNLPIRADMSAGPMWTKNAMKAIHIN